VFSYIKNALYNNLGFISKIMPRKENENVDENKVLGFLMGLGAGAIVYAFLSLFEKPRCPICKKEIEKRIRECPYCHSKLSWS
jgi:hypothetical protein